MVCALVCAFAVSADSARAGWPLPAAGVSQSGGPEVILTFDDGPHERYTAMILDELDDRGLQAIFFWVGRRLSGGKGLDDRKALVGRAVREGHLVANHTMTHAHLCSVPADTAASEIDDNARLLERLTGLPMRLFRTPYGDYCRRLREILAARDLDHMHWDIDPQEWIDHDSTRTAQYVIGKLRRLEGRAVLLMHDTHLSTARALPEVLDWIEAENIRRLAAGRAPIRIVPPSALIRGRAPVATWAAELAGAAGSRWGRAVAALIP